MKKLEWALLLGMVGAVCCSALTGTAQSYRSLEQNVLRLHILANSDSIDDQALKLKVRDKVLEQADTLFAGDAESVEDAETIAAENLETLEQTAQQLVWDEGYSYPVKAQLVEMPFDDRTYGDWVMPAGEYTALRITIGAAQGQNWCTRLCVSPMPAMSPQTKRPPRTLSESRSRICCGIMNAMR